MFTLQTLLEVFLDKGGNPFVSNSSGDTPLHLVCTSAKFSSRRSKRKADQLQLLLNKMTPAEITQSLKKDESKKSTTESRFTQSLLWFGGVGGARDGSEGCGAEAGLGVQNKVSVHVLVILSFNISNLSFNCVRLGTLRSIWQLLLVYSTVWRLVTPTPPPHMSHTPYPHTHSSSWLTTPPYLYITWLNRHRVTWRGRQSN